MRNQRRGIVMAIAGLIVLAANVIDATQDGTSGWNVIAIVTGAGLLFYGFTVVARPDA
jgi:uncharacterized membrane protein HdeD (DUF308 family)